jgi:N6-L-threonylcarbamoyladenine synthase
MAGASAGALVLGIESSCDETSAAVVEDGRRVRSNVVASQDEVHAPYGGVVPELASRQHLRNIGPVVHRALQDAGVELSKVDAVAVTQGPGLIGSLLVGVSFGKSIAYALGIPLVGVDHLEGHIRAVYLESEEPIPHPAISLVVSGGHTSLFLMEAESRYELIAKTRDDAAGEAYDKVAKKLGLGYPGGPILDRLARLGDPKAFEFSLPRFSDGSEDFSFSGLKSAVLRAILDRDVAQLTDGVDPETRSDICDLAASFQATVVKLLTKRTESAVKRYRARAILVSGGVAANRELRERFALLSQKLSIPAMFPSVKMSTDNAAMIAAAGYLKLQRNELSDLELNADVEMRLGEDGTRRSRRHH